MQMRRRMTLSGDMPLKQGSTTWLLESNASLCTCCAHAAMCQLACMTLLGTGFAINSWGQSGREATSAHLEYASTLSLWKPEFFKLVLLYTLRKC